MKKFRVAIIGCGAIFPMHATSIKICEYTELVAVCDIIEERALKEAVSFNCRAYTDFEKMIEVEKPDAVHICLPHYLHSSVAIYCLERGINVLTEKPMAISFEEASLMISAAEKSRAALGCILQNRFNHGNLFLKKVFDEGGLGKILGAKCFVTWNRDDEYYASSPWRASIKESGGGVIINQAIHTIDAMTYLLNSEAVRVDATIANRGRVKMEVEDTAEGVIEFKNGVLASFHAINYYSSNSPAFVEFDCEKGRATLVSDTATVFYNDGRRETSTDAGVEVDYGDKKDYWGMSHIKQITDFYKALAGEKEMYVGLKSALESHKIVFAIYESGRTNSPIYL